jgi:pimeloyl-ACP methyl ester carboxylesterase
MPPNDKPPIVLIHGLWLTSLSWENVVERYRTRGFDVVARSWPGMEGKTVQQLRDDPSVMDNLGISEIVDHYASIIEAQPRSPIIMGHSFGGLITQILLDRGYGVAGVAFDSAPAKGIFALPWSSLKAAFPVLKNPANRHRAVMLRPEEFQYGFTNAMPLEDGERAYQRYAVPGSGRVLFQGAFANFAPQAAAKVDFHNPERPPLLIATGGEDHISPPKLDATIAKLQRKGGALTAFKVFPGRSHLILAQKGWEEVADFALDWALHPRELNEP